MDGGGTALPSHPRTGATSSMAGAEQDHTRLPLALPQVTFYPLGRLAYEYRHPFNKNLIHSSIPRVSKVKCINGNTNSEQKVVINVQCTCAASLIMLPGNRGRDGRALPGAL